MLQQSLQNALAAARIERDVVTVDHPDAGRSLRSRAQAADQADRPSAQSKTKPRRLREAGPRGRQGRRGRLAPDGDQSRSARRRRVSRRSAACSRQGTIVIAAGGGGPPVYADPLLGLEGVDAVVDKDRVSAILATQLGAEVLLILTNVEAVYEGWSTPAARPIRRMTVDRGERAGRRRDARRRGHEAEGGSRGVFRAADGWTGPSSPDLGTGPRRASRRDRDNHREGSSEHPRVSGPGPAQGRRASRCSDGDVASTPTEAEAIARRLGGPVVIKAQVHAGGRGKAGGVKLARTPGEALDHASEILGMRSRDSRCRRCSWSPPRISRRESYLGLIMDRETQRPVFMVSAAGGMDIEEVAAKTPEKIMRLAGGPDVRPAPAPGAQSGLRALPRLRPGQGGREDHASSCTPPSSPTARRSPRSTRWSTTPDGQVLALDAKIVIDDNELFGGPTSARCATTPPRSRARRRRGAPTCRSSSSTAMSAAW